MGRAASCIELLRQLSGRRLELGEVSASHERLEMQGHPFPPLAPLGFFRLHDARPEDDGIGI